MSEIIFGCTSINLVKPTFKEEIKIFGKHYKCVKYKKKEEEKNLIQKILLKKCHIQRKTVSIMTNPHIYLELAPPLSEKRRNGLNPLISELSNHNAFCRTTPVTPGCLNTFFEMIWIGDKVSTSFISLALSFLEI